MIRLDRFSVNVLPDHGIAHEFQEQGAYYVALPDRSEYSLQLNNYGNTIADATITIDGDVAGTWRVNPRNSITIERPAYIQKKFTFVDENGPEAQEAGVVRGNNQNGLITIEFRTKKEPYVLSSPQRVLRDSSAYASPPRYPSPRHLTSMAGSSHLESASLRAAASMHSNPNSLRSASAYSSGATVLGDYSSQRFVDVEPIRPDQVDYQHSPTITFRLVVDRFQGSPRYSRIGSYMPSRTPYPPRIDY